MNYIILNIFLNYIIKPIKNLTIYKYIYDFKYIMSEITKNYLFKNSYLNLFVKWLYLFLIRYLMLNNQ